MNRSSIKNPILSGFYPDPSICRVGKDFYLINSSFVFFPGIPIFHSTDLVHWKQLGYVLDRPEQLPLSPDILSGGIFAPTIRYHEGTFYVICTNLCGKGNFIVTSENPEGPWSDVHWVEGAEGIDPSLFWDDDGKAYYTGTVGFGKEPSLWVGEIDLRDFRICSEKKNIWAGALKDCHSPEGPHLYKKDGWYYLMIAEGGTEVHHAVTIARSRNIKGPYTGNPANPILTHRHLGQNYPICNVGHADMVELEDGSWYIVALGSRIYGGYHKNMGRETFIAPVVWENGWPVISAGTGKIEWEYPAPELPESEADPVHTFDDFNSEKPDLSWNTIGTPEKGVITVKSSSLCIRTASRPVCPEDGQMIDWMSAKKKIEQLGFLGRRQQHMSFDVKTKFRLKFISGQESAGLIVLQNSYQSIRAEMKQVNGSRFIEVILGYIKKDFSFGEKSAAGDNGEGSTSWAFQHNTGAGVYHTEKLALVPWDEETVTLKLHAVMQDYTITAENEAGEETPLAEHIDAGFLGAETAGGCIGAYIGMFASGNGIDTDNQAEFEYFEYLPNE